MAKKKKKAEKSEHNIQVDFFAAKPIAERYGIDVAILWAQREEPRLKRPLGSVLLEENPHLPGPANEITELAWLHAIPNGGTRGSTVADRQRVGAMLKAEGVRSGVADVFLPLARQGYHGFYIEFKKNKTARQRETQKGFQEYCDANGYLYGVTSDAVEALRGIKWYLG